MTFAINHLFLNQNLQLRPSLTACVKVCEWAQAGVMISITPHGPWFAGACAVCSASSTALSIRSQHHEHSADAHVCMQMFRCRLGRRKKLRALPSSLTCRCVVALVVFGAFGGVWGIRWCGACSLGTRDTHALTVHFRARTETADRSSCSLAK